MQVHWRDLHIRFLGKQTNSSGSLTNPFQYVGREFDSESSLYYMRARYFDPSTGRFISEDPISFDGGENFYAYTRNSPVRPKESLRAVHLPSNVPPPSPALDKSLKCLDGKVGPVTVTATF